jgi:hypothetical protein
MLSNKIIAVIYNEFEEFRCLHSDKGFRIVPSLVETLGGSWAKDLERFEDFHQSENSEPHKQAAFLVYWMSKVKPIAIASHHKHSRQITINEIFAFVLAMKMLGIGHGRISADFFEHFVYSLYYRDTSARQMFFTFEMLDRLNKNIPDGQQIA